MLSCSSWSRQRPWTFSSASPATGWRFVRRTACGTSHLARGPPGAALAACGPKGRLSAAAEPDAVTHRCPGAVGDEDVFDAGDAAFGRRPYCFAWAPKGPQMRRPLATLVRSSRSPWRPRTSCCLLGRPRPCLLRRTACGRRPCSRPARAAPAPRGPQGRYRRQATDAGTASKSGAVGDRLLVARDSRPAASPLLPARGPQTSSRPFGRNKCR